MDRGQLQTAFNLFNRKMSDEEDLQKQRGKRRTYCFNYPALVETEALRSMLEKAVVRQDRKFSGERKYFIDQLEGVFINEAENKKCTFSLEKERNQVI